MAIMRMRAIVCIKVFFTLFLSFCRTKVFIFLIFQIKNAFFLQFCFFDTGIYMTVSFVLVLKVNNLPDFVSALFLLRKSVTFSPGQGFVILQSLF